MIAIIVNCVIYKMGIPHNGITKLVVLQSLWQDHECRILLSDWFCFFFFFSTDRSRVRSEFWSRNSKTKGTFRLIRLVDFLGMIVAVR